MTETGMKMMQFVVLLYVLLAMYARKVPFLPQPPVDLTQSGPSLSGPVFFSRPRHATAANRNGIQRQFGLLQ